MCARKRALYQHKAAAHPTSCLYLPVQVRELYEAHKAQHSAYARRCLEFVEVDHSKAAKRERDVSPHVFATRLAMLPPPLFVR